MNDREDDQDVAMVEGVTWQRGKCCWPDWAQIDRDIAADPLPAWRRAQIQNMRAVGFGERTKPKPAVSHKTSSTEPAPARRYSRPLPWDIDARLAEWRLRR